MVGKSLRAGIMLFMPLVIERTGGCTGDHMLVVSDLAIWWGETHRVGPCRLQGASPDCLSNFVMNYPIPPHSRDCSYWLDSSWGALLSSDACIPTALLWLDQFHRMRQHYGKLEWLLPATFFLMVGWCCTAYYNFQPCVGWFFHCFLVSTMATMAACVFWTWTERQWVTIRVKVRDCCEWMVCLYQ